MKKGYTIAPSLVLLLLTSVLYQFYPAHALSFESFNGYQIKDLTSKDLTTFAFETQDWTISGLTGSTNSSLCGLNNPVLGGYNTFSNNLKLSKIYSALPVHSAIYYQITFNFIDKFKNPDYFTLTLDSTSIPGGNSLITYNTYATSNICGGSAADTTQFTITGSMPHTANTLNFQLSAKASTGVGSGTLGIRDIQLTFANDSSITSSQSCFRVADTQLFGLSGECPCVKGSYKNGGACSTCHPSCKDCSGPSASQCYSCAAGYSWDGNQCIQCDSSCSTCTGTAPSQCVTCKSGYWLQTNGSCTATCDLPVYARQVVGYLQVCSSPCTSSQFVLWDGSCSSNCSFPLIASTLDSTKLCDQPCQTGEFLYWNGSCISGCKTPLISSNLNGAPVCNKPCQNSEYLYWNSSCLGDCLAPFVDSISSPEEEVLLCDKPCQNNEYLYWNNSCITTCQSPLVSSVSNGLSVCNKPCQNNEYLYQNGSCLSTCSSPYTQSSSLGVDLCQLPCASSSQFLYPNGSCLNQCRAPLLSSTIDGVKSCNSPCASQSDYYHPSNSSCEASCLLPNTIQLVEFVQICILETSDTTPKNSLSSQDKQFVDQAKTVTQATGKTTTVGVIASSLLSSRGTNAITLVSLVKMLDYIRYIDVNYPTKLQYMLDSGEEESSISLHLDVEFGEDVQRKFPNYPLPGKFGEYDLKSNFILNYSGALITLVILLVVLGVSMVLTPKLQGVKYVGMACGKVRDLIKWNFFLIVLCENVESVGVFSSMEFRTTHFNSFVSVFGTLVCCFVNLIILYLIFVVPYIIYSLRRNRAQILPVTNENAKSAEEDKKKRFEDCEVLFVNFKEKSVWQHSCMFFILVRIYLFYMIIGYLFEYPLAQAILITLMSVLMLGYLSISRPFKNKLELLKNITYESIIALVNLCVLILTIVEHKNVDNQGMKNRLGDVIIIANTVFNIIALLFIVVDVFIRIFKAYQLRKTIKEKGLKYWVKIATILFEPEEMESNHQSHPSLDNKKPETSSIVPKKMVTFKQERIAEADSISDSQIVDLKKSPSDKSRVFPSQTASSLNAFLPTHKNTISLFHEGAPSFVHQESRPNSYRSLLGSSQELEFQYSGNENPPKEMKFKRHLIIKRRTFQIPDVDSSFECEMKPKVHSLVLDADLKNNLKSSVRKMRENIVE